MNEVKGRMEDLPHFKFSANVSIIDIFVNISKIPGRTIKSPSSAVLRKYEPENAEQERELETRMKNRAIERGAMDEVDQFLHDNTPLQMCLWLVVKVRYCSMVTRSHLMTKSLQPSSNTTSSLIMSPTVS